MQVETKVFVVLCTCPPQSAEGLASSVVEKGLAACVNILPRVESVYRWQGEVQKDAESLLVIKCAAPGFPALRDALVAAHPYEVPEVIALAVEDGSRSYLDWVLGAGRPESGGAP
jgi:periplasmic divalent cation tolerance protein